MSPTRETRAPAAQFGPYRLLEKLAESPLSQVYRAQKEGGRESDGPVTLERIRPALASDPRVVRTFVSEAASGAALSHPNLVRVVDFGKINDSYFVAMEHVRGWSLEVVLARATERNTTLPMAAAVWIASCAAAALEHAHERRARSGRSSAAIPGCVTPRSILISERGEVKVVPFDIREAAGESRAGGAAVSQHDLPYLSPEGVKDEPVDARSDVFSLGRVLFEMITGTGLVRSINVVGTIHRWEIDRALAALPDLPAPIHRVLHRALQSNPERRFGSAREMQRDLESYIATLDEPIGETEMARLVRRLFDDPSDSGTAGMHPAAPPRGDVRRFSRTSLAWVGGTIVTVQLFAIAAPQVRAAWIARTEARQAIQDLARGLPATAVSRFDRAFADAPSWLASRLRARHSGEYVDALERDGTRHLSAGDLDAARGRFEAAAELDPKRLGPHLSLGRIHTRSMDARSAERAFLAAVAIDPASEIAREALGSIYFEQGRYANALEQYQRLVTLQPGNLDEVWLRIAACHRHLAHTATGEAEAALQQGLAARRRRQQDLDEILALFDGAPPPSPTPAARVAPATAGPTSDPPEDLVHRVECPGECLRDIAEWHTGSGENWRKLVSPVNPGVNSECVVLKVGRELRIPTALVSRVEKMPCRAVAASAGSR